ncbi:hypothetical protein TNCV_3172811 [Trichonephila clavipes]|nr:hypothetical protein TNCV_3172811 [Trichonephila clavipes]
MVRKKLNVRTVRTSIWPSGDIFIPSKYLVRSLDMVVEIMQLQLISVMKGFLTGGEVSLHLGIASASVKLKVSRMKEPTLELYPSQHACSFEIG